jgi:hypothetical protein
MFTRSSNHRRFWSVLLVLPVIAAGGVSLHRALGTPSQALNPLPPRQLDRGPVAITTFGSTMQATIPADIPNKPVNGCTPQKPGWIKRENIKPGVSGVNQNWRNLPLTMPRLVNFWVSPTSVTCGGSVTLHASTISRAMVEVRFEALRIGWYGGSGARAVWKSKPVRITHWNTPLPAGAVRLVETTWPVSLSMTVGQKWTPGFYLLIAKGLNGRILSAQPLILRSPEGASALMLMHSTLTWQAYNDFGGYSLYRGPGSTITAIRANRSRIVSMDRPIVGSGAIHVARDALAFTQYLEKAGFDIDHVADTDINQWPSIATHYNGMVISGHAEYFTRRMFVTTMALRAKGTNLAIFGGNTAWWQARVEASPSGAERHIIVYRTATEDPIRDPKLLTVQWRDKRLGMAGALLTGGIDSAVHVGGSMKLLNLPKWLHVKAGTVLGNFPITSETEQSAIGIAAPTDIDVIAQGRMTNGQFGKRRVFGTQQMLWFTTASGAAVFNAGINTWTCQLTPTCIQYSVTPTSSQIMGSITKQILTLWARPRVGVALES